MSTIPIRSTPYILYILWTIQYYKNAINLLPGHESLGTAVCQIPAVHERAYSAIYNASGSGIARCQNEGKTSAAATCQSCITYLKLKVISEVYSYETYSMYHAFRTF